MHKNSPCRQGLEKGTRTKVRGKVQAKVRAMDPGLIKARVWLRPVTMACSRA